MVAWSQVANKRNVETKKCVVGHHDVIIHDPIRSLGTAQIFKILARMEGKRATKNETLDWISYFRKRKKVRRYWPWRWFTNDEARAKKETEHGDSRTRKDTRGIVFSSSDSLSNIAKLDPFCPRFVLVIFTAYPFTKKMVVDLFVLIAVLLTLLVDDLPWGSTSFCFFVHLLPYLLV